MIQICSKLCLRKEIKRNRLKLNNTLIKKGSKESKEKKTRDKGEKKIRRNYKRI